MNIRIPDYALPYHSRYFDVTAEVDFIADTEIDQIPRGGDRQDSVRYVPVYGNKPISVDRITIESGGIPFSSSQLKELVDDVVFYCLDGEGVNDINPT